MVKKNRLSTNQEIHIILWHLKVHHILNKSPLLFCILSQMNPVLALPKKYETHIVCAVYLFLKFYYIF